MSGFAPKPCLARLRHSVLLGPKPLSVPPPCFYGIGKDFLDALDFGFQSGVFLFNRYGFADPPKVLTLSSMLSIFSLRLSVELPSSLSAISLSSSELRRCFFLFPPCSPALYGLSISFGLHPSALAASFSALTCSASCFCLAMMKSVSFQMLLACQLF